MNVYDASRLGYGNNNRRSVCEWLRREGLDPMNVYRVEVEGSTATVYEYLRNAGGKRYFDHSKGEPAKRDPYVVTITTDPPVLP